MNKISLAHKYLFLERYYRYTHELYIYKIINGIYSKQDYKIIYLFETSWFHITYFLNYEK